MHAMLSSMLIRQPCCSLIWSRNKILRSAIQLTIESTFTSKSDTVGGKDPLLKTSFHENGMIATLTLNHPPINSLNLELNTAISDAIREIETQRPNTQAVVLKSFNSNVFSAGIDLMELYQPKSENHLRKFWKSFQQLFIDIYSCKFTTIAAIEGHAPAGGCMVAMACDYRIMVDNPLGNTIGLSETKLGIVAPYWLADLMVNTIGYRQAEKALGLGLLYTPEKALDMGLIDEVISIDQDINETLYEEAMKWAKIPLLARQKSKMLLRRKLLQNLEKNREHDIDSFCEFVMNEHVQKSLGLYIQNLKQKKQVLK